MMGRFRIAMALAAFSTAAIWGGCDGGVTDPVEEDGPGILSNPLAIALSAHSTLSASAAATTQLGVVHMSLSPATVPDGELAVVRNLDDPVGTVIVSVRDGGFDPVPVVAEPGDAVEVLVSVRGSATPISFTRVVPSRRRPVIVRTDPAPRKRDVPLNAAIVIVFSEPVDSTTIQEPNIQVRRAGGAAVPGTARWLGGTATTVVFLPSEPLAANTNYQIAITSAVRDQQGEAATPLQLEAFTTGTEFVPPVSRLTVLPDTALLAIGSGVQLTAIPFAGDDTISFPILIAGVPVTWSSNSPTVADVSPTGLVVARGVGEARIRGEVQQSGVFGVFGSSVVFVVEAIDPVGSVEVTPAAAEFPVASKIRLAAVVRNADGAPLAFRPVSWSTSNSSIATVEPAPGGTAWVTSHAAGTVTITATSEGKSGTASLTSVTPGRYVAVSTGPQHSCGLTEDGWTLCWGSNHGGQLGNTTRNTSFTPVPVATWVRFSSVFAGGQRTCALTSDSTAYCWGANWDGGLGIGSTTGPERCDLTGVGACSTSPILVHGGRKFGAFAAFSSSATHVCALDAEGTAFCWGANANGQLGVGSFSGPEACQTLWSDTPTACSSVPVAVSGGLTFVQMTVGSGYTCGLTPTGAAYCWGLNEQGQLGDGTTINRASPVAVAGGHVFASLSAGFRTTCGVTTSGAGYCWGWNFSGQLGIGTTAGPEQCASQSCSTVPVAVVGPLTWTQLSVGQLHVCAVATDFRTYCWGSNGSGTLGNGSHEDSALPVAVTGGFTFAGVSCGDSHTCAITSDRIAYCWGSVIGLGVGTPGFSDSPTPVKVLGQP